jgi:hypothetical protein
MRRNHWVTDKVPVAAWILAAPPPETASLPQSALTIIQTILVAGEAHEVFVTGDADAHLARVRSHYEESRRAPVFDHLRPAGRIAFHIAEGVREEVVEDLGALLPRIEKRSGLDRYSTSCPPVRIGALDPLQPTLPLEIWISLYTDIWFPQVLGFAEPGLSDRMQSREFFDNRPLAERHTPRLNRFFQAVRGAAIVAGATWEIDRDNDARYDLYREMYSAEGIHL